VKIRPENAIDFYKTGHIRQYPEGTEYVHSNFTPRSTRILQKRLGRDYDERIVHFGLYGVIRWFLQDCWNEQFFQKSKFEVVKRFKNRMDKALGPGAVSADHIGDLHDLGYLPIRICALPEGVTVKAGVPVFTIDNTLPQFYWIVNYLESVLSACVWKSSVNATIARHYRKLFEKYADMTGVDRSFVDIQGHDFSFRGMSGLHDAAASGAAHLTSFIGTDTVPAIDYLEDYYHGELEDVIGIGVPATEHSVMCLGTKGGEIGTFRRLINEIYPTGVVSIVSDTWDYWRVLTEYLPILKPDILARQPDANGLAKVVIRPDSGDPVKIVVGDPSAPEGSPERKGSVEVLWGIFGGSINDLGYKVLDPHIGLIYGDSITPDRAKDILVGLARKGFASSNIVFGIGSYTYQCNTRDSLGYALKATFGIVNGEEREIFKDPATDDGTKKSAKGRVQVGATPDDEFYLMDQCSEADDAFGMLQPIFRDGELCGRETLGDIRDLIRYS